MHQAVELLLDGRTPSPGGPTGIPVGHDLDRRFCEGQPLSWQELLVHLREIISASVDLAAPGYVGHMDPPPTVASIVGDMVSSAVNNNLLFLELSPGFTEMEETLLGDLSRRFGLGDAAGGIMLPGGSLANLQALVLARNAAGARRRGDHRMPLSIVMSDAAHVSFRKACMIMGIGHEGLHVVPTGTDGRVDCSRLASVVTAIAERQEPMCVIATAGTTITGGIDPLSEIGDIAHQHGAWFHVDAAFGGMLAFSSRARERLKGIERADSLTFNPQKGLCVARTAAMLLLKRKSDLRELFRVETPYAGGNRLERGELSLQGSSRTDILKVWLTLRHLGISGCAALVERSLGLVHDVAAQLCGLRQIQLAARPDTPVLCFRGHPLISSDSIDGWNLQLRSYLQGRLGLVLSAPRWKGARWLRLVTINPLSKEDLARQLVHGIESFYAMSGGGSGGEDDAAV